MQSLRDAATLGVLILVALTVRVGPIESALDFDTVRAAGIEQEAAEPAVPAEPPSDTCSLDAAPPVAGSPVIVQTEATEQPARHFVRKLDDDRRVLIILEAETEAAPDRPSTPGPAEPIDTERGAQGAHLSC